MSIQRPSQNPCQNSGQNSGQIYKPLFAIFPLYLAILGCLAIQGCTASSQANHSLAIKPIPPAKQNSTQRTSGLQATRPLAPPIINQTTLASALKQKLTQPQYSKLLPVYQQRNFRPIWINHAARHVPLLRALNNAHSHGLNPADYPLAAIARIHSNIIANNADAKRYAELDLLMSTAFSLYAKHMVKGRFNPKDLEENWHITQAPYNPNNSLYMIAAGRDVEHILEKLAPPFPAYQALKEALAHYKKMSANGGWQTKTPLRLATHNTLKLGDTSPAIGQLRKRLSYSLGIANDTPAKTLTAFKLSEESFLVQYLDASLATKQQYPKAQLRQVLRNFQRNHGLKPSGTLDSNTRNLIHSKRHAPENVFDRAVEMALKQFQQQHGLTPDGKLGRNTLVALNQSPQQRAQQIAANMERYRWLPKYMGDHYLLVDIANYQMRIMKNGKPVFRSAIIAGREERATPSFNDKLRYLQFKPHWNIPDTIVYEDVLPALKEDPDYLAKEHIQVLSDWKAGADVIDPSTVDWDQYSNEEGHRMPYRLQQAPGPNNSLGLVKFMFPNQFNIYLHDTPHKALFNKTKRSLSSGCIRVENFTGLAQYLFENAQPQIKESTITASNSKEQIKQLLMSDDSTRVELAQPLPIYMVYFTADANSDGRISFRPDIYHRDPAMIARLRQNTQQAQQYAALDF